MPNLEATINQMKIGVIPRANGYEDISAGGPGSGRRKATYKADDKGNPNKRYASVSKGLINQGFKKTSFDTNSTSFNHPNGGSAKIHVDKNRDLNLRLDAPETVHHNMKLMMK